MTGDILEVSANKDGGSIKTTGDGAGRLTNSLADALSPFTGAAGALGDVIHFFRQENAIRSLASAKKLADEMGVKAKPVPPKFLVQWVEAASLEEPGEGDLSDMWAGLLVDASQGLKPTHLTFKRILSEITSRHVELLKWLCDFDTQADAFPYKQIISRYGAYNKLADEQTKSGMIQELEGFYPEHVADTAEGINAPGLKVHTISTGLSGDPLWFMRDRKYQGTRLDARPFVEDHSVKQLELMGLVGELSLQVKCHFGSAKERGVMDVSAWHVLPFGLDFLRAVSPRGSSATLQSTGG